MIRPPVPTGRPGAARRRAAVLLPALLALAASLPGAPAALATEAPRTPTAAGQGRDDGAARARARLDAFAEDIVSFRADFEQTLYDADSRPLQSSTGTVVLKRPGRFVWRYDDGADAVAQTIVADGTRVWLYDRELAQVTVNDIDERVSGTPFVLLMGGAALEEAYAITALGASEGIEWLELVPKSAGGDFEALFVGLDERGLAAIELRDNFGQATQIRFTDFEPNVTVADATFDFEVPEGVDVIGLEE